MCGIAGILQSADSNLAISPETIISKILEEQHRRGPDVRHQSQHNLSYGRCFLGHNRLSIIDLNERANQPFSDPSKRYEMVFNGVIYNYLTLRKCLIGLGHQFHTESDTEVLLTAFIQWQEACLHKLEGMFAFAILDKKTEKLFLARDRFGVKPLFYLLQDRHFVFASQANVIAQTFHLPPNLEYVARGISQWVYEDATQSTQYIGLEALLAGTYLSLDLKQNLIEQMQPKRYYDLNKKVVSYDVNDLYTHVSNSVNLRLRSDVPIGLSLSGGIDSSIVAALACDKIPKLSCFTLGGEYDPGSESKRVKKLSERLALKVEYIDPREHDLVSLFWDTLDAQDAPFPSASVMGQHLVFKQAHRAGCKVMLGGQGGDEAFMGYRKYLLSDRSNLLDLMKTLYAEKYQWRVYINALYRKLNAKRSLFDCIQIKETDHKNQNRQCNDILSNSLPTLLRYEDRNSMYHSIESRLPFLNHELIEYGLSLPTQAKIKHGFTKYCLREVYTDKLPHDIIWARDKRGFDVALSPWLERGLGRDLRAYLNDHHSKLKQLLPLTINIDHYFSDRILHQSSLRFSEAVSLTWLAKRV